MARQNAAQLLREDGLPEQTSLPSIITISSSSAPGPPSTSLRKRPASDAKREKKMDGEHPTLSGIRDVATEEIAIVIPASWASRNQWVIFAIASGACAAFNGVFAKLTTNNLTSHISQGFAGIFGLNAYENVVEIIFRGIFFGLNLAFNGVMWTLFTKALARGESTTQVSIMNTSANFMITALLGLMIFSESLPPLWWLGAAMLVAGNVIIGRKDESSSTEENAVSVESCTSMPSYATVPQEDPVLPVEKEDSDDEDVPLIGDVEGSTER